MIRFPSCKLTSTLLLSQIILTTIFIWIFTGGYEYDRAGRIRNAESRDLLSYEYVGTGNSALVVESTTKTNINSNLIGSHSPEEALWDKWHLFKTIPFALKAQNWNELASSRAVCLGAQSSIDRLYWITKTIREWSGLISISLFTPDYEYILSDIFIKHYLYRCFPEISKRVSFHFTFPGEHPLKNKLDEKKLRDLEKMTLDFKCSGDPSVLSKELMNTRPKEMMEWREKFAYPQNLLRNIARSGCPTNFTFIPDIDMIPIPGLDSHLEKFLREPTQASCQKCAYVIPTYEISEKSTFIPRNKSSLMDLIKKNKARAFHIQIFVLNQKSSNLTQWQKLPPSNTTKIAYKIKNFIYGYEPVYVSRGNVPQFDERFIGFGLTRNSQIYEMRLADYDFYILNNLFLNHWGYQYLKARPKWRNIQQSKNGKKFKVFVEELKAHYGNKDPDNMLANYKSLLS